ncbi:hypothetical protein NDU88_003703 [Pleurodeles waltl]|uniref:Uncharacterized protein n=1 Tax=Pleurodeles waltl TaxID=8319 RepID=A0AAV7KZ96_PLEWA|nr:hypothetical protein NDU88_003703 [Pleurodeles waltl]
MAWSSSAVSSLGETRKDSSPAHGSGRSSHLLRPGRLVLRPSPRARSARPRRSSAAAGRVSLPGHPVPWPRSQARPTQPQRCLSSAGRPLFPGRYVSRHEPLVRPAKPQRSSAAPGCRVSAPVPHESPNPQAPVRFVGSSAPPVPLSLRRISRVRHGALKAHAPLVVGYC